MDGRFSVLIGYVRVSTNDQMTVI
ncbi:DNA invertase, partial [Escherichia coli]